MNLARVGTGHPRHTTQAETIRGLLTYEGVTATERNVTGVGTGQQRHATHDTRGDEHCETQCYSSERRQSIMLEHGELRIRRTLQSREKRLVGSEGHPKTERQTEDSSRVQEHRERLRQVKAERPAHGRTNQGERSAHDRNQAELQTKWNGHSNVASLAHQALDTADLDAWAHQRTRRKHSGLPSRVWELERRADGAGTRDSPDTDRRRLWAVIGGRLVVGGSSSRAAGRAKPR